MHRADTAVSSLDERMKLVFRSVLVLIVLVVTAILLLFCSAYERMPNEDELRELFLTNSDGYYHLTEQTRRSLIGNESPPLQQDDALGYLAVEVTLEPFGVRYHSARSGVGVGVVGAGVVYLEDPPEP
jgi:hypothetical protein